MESFGHLGSTPGPKIVNGRPRCKTDPRPTSYVELCKTERYKILWSAELAHLHHHPASLSFCHFSPSLPPSTLVPSPTTV
ncbi:hypothetical protein CEXT_8141 [Caerostris extrusa]|uniref:Uncharacterized protein n=1 Tax=Caerostris extrusa TaxID=172846 RepID=A0AAV4XUN0_CAEEX|nr:hypothetical protein CEXT_8141 [Caerostris extrusa]